MEDEPCRVLRAPSVDEVMLERAITHVLSDANDLALLGPVGQQEVTDAPSTVERDAGGTAPVELGSFLTGVATRVAIITDSVMEMHSHVSEVHVDPQLARGLGALAIEVTRVLSASPSGRRVRVYLSCDWVSDGLVLAIACPEAAGSPVPIASAARSCARAVHLARALGGDLVRGIEADCMLFGALFVWEER